MLNQAGNRNPTEAKFAASVQVAGRAMCIKFWNNWTTFEKVIALLLEKPKKYTKILSKFLLN